MKRIFLLPLSLLIVNTIFAQSASVTWGDEFKLKRGSEDVSVICGDNTGLYLKEYHLEIKNYFIDVYSGYAPELIKLDQNLKEVYIKDFNKEIKNKTFLQFYTMKDQMFIFAYNYNNKAQLLSLYGAEINKSTGDFVGEWQEMCNWKYQEKISNVSFKIYPGKDGSTMLVVSQAWGKDEIPYQVQEFDNKFKRIGNSINITDESDINTYQLQNVLLTENNKIILLAKQMEYEEGKKPKEKLLVFKNYSVRIYNTDGKREKEINTDIQGKWLTTASIMQQKGSLMLTAFYSNEKKGKYINGLLVQKINASTGEVLNTSLKDINTSQTSNTTESDNDDEDKKSSKKEKFEKITEGEGLSRTIEFKRFVPTSDNGIVILAENNNQYQISIPTWVGSGSSGTWTNDLHTVYERGNIMISKVDAQGNITWLHILPKFQTERDDADLLSFGIITGSNTANIIFNDNKNNSAVLELGQKISSTKNLDKSNCDMISLDLISGKCTRSTLFNNKEQPTVMPALGAAIGNCFYIVGKEYKSNGKCKIEVAKVAIK